MTDQPSLYDDAESVAYERWLQDDVAHARTSDPLTSHDAAASIPSDKIRASQEAVLRMLREHGPMCDQEIAEKYEYRGGWGGCPLQSESGLRTRRSELVAKGLVRDSGERVVLRSGRKSIVWAATTVTVSHEIPNG